MEFSLYFFISQDIFYESYNEVIDHMTFEMKLSLVLTILLAVICLVVVIVLCWMVAKSIGRPMKILMKLTKIFKTNKEDYKKQFN